jgi:hypothetical protein
MNFHQTLAALLSVLMLHPSQLSAALQGSTGPVAVLGSIAAYGSVQVAGFPALPESTLFLGDRVSTGTGRAVIQYRTGARILLADDSAAQFSAEQVVLQKGQMTFRSVSVDGPAYVASTLRLEPLAAGSAASMTLSDGKASVAVSATVTVSEGSVRIVDSTTGQTFSVRAGETREFAVAFPNAASPAPTSAGAPAAPQSRTRGSTAYWLLGLGAGAAGGAVAARSLAGSQGEQAPEVSRSRP